MIIKRISSMLCGVFLTVINSANTQELLPVMYDTTVVENQIVMNGSFFHHGTALTNDIARKLIFGGEIAEEQSRNALGKHHDFNRVGGGAKFRVTYKAGHQLFKSKPHWSWMIEASNEIHAYSEYSDGVFGLALMGNKEFLGETVSLSSLSARSIYFMSLGGGIHNKKNKNFITLNAILPMDYFQLNVNRGSISFSEDGTNVGLKLEGEIIEETELNDINGLGAALSFDFNIPFGNTESFNGFLRISGRNIGVYHLEGARVQNMDANISYSGFSVSDFTNDSGIATLKDTLGVSESTSSITRLLPGFIQIGKVASAHSKSKIQSTFGIRVYANTVYRPMVYIGAHYQATSQFSFGTQATLGGYGNLRLGLYANYKAKNVMIGLGTEDILGALFQYQYGESGLIRLAWRF